MQRINSAYFYTLATKLIPLRGITHGKTVIDFFGDIYGAQEELGYFLSNPIIPPHTSEGTGRQLQEILIRMSTNPFPDPPTDPPTFRVIQWGEAKELGEALQKFEISLQSDFAVRDTFICSPKAAYSTTLLAERGENLVSLDAHALVPSMSQDLHDAARCMAFELSTAAAFHFFRAVEAMVVAYGQFVRGKPFTQPEKKKGLGGMVNLLKERSLQIDPRITNAIEQLALLHRNPTMHPEIHISTNEIMVTVGIAVSVIEIVALDWKRRKETPGKPLSEMLPDDTTVEDLPLTPVRPLLNEGITNEKKRRKRLEKSSKGEASQN